MLRSVLAFLKANALFISMLIGVMIGILELQGLWLWHAPGWVLPGCIFLMLFFTFLRMDPLTLRLHRWHAVVLSFQLVVSLLLYYVCRRVDMVLAQGLFVCVLMPSGTAAPIIAGRLGGNVLNLTAYTLMSNALTAIFVPLLFPLVSEGVDMPFAESFVLILRHISPVLLVPFAAAWLIRIAMRLTFHRDPQLGGWLREMPFWLWVLTLVILMARMTLDLAHYDGNLMVLAGMFAGALLTCLLQFYSGKWIGECMPVLSPEETRVTAGQALGQKNTTLAIWLASTYLNPVSALAPAAYIIWQNLFNSWQLNRVSRGGKI